MAHIDETFKATCRRILEEGVSDQGQAVRPKWPDGTPAHTKKIFGVVNRYDLAEEFPLMTLRFTPFKTLSKEILWIWVQKSNLVQDLGAHIWDAWADEQGSIGKAYGYQLRQKHHYADGDYDQVDRLLKDLRENPSSRRMITSLFNHADLHEMHLYPCAWSMTFNVTGRRLNAILNQRSQDMLAANAFNVAQYALLVHMLAQVSDLEAGELVHVIADAHIYDRHEAIVEALLERPTFAAPVLHIDPAVRDFYQFKPDSFTLENYQYGPKIERFEVAE